MLTCQGPCLELENLSEDSVCGAAVTTNAIWSAVDILPQNNAERCVAEAAAAFERAFGRRPVEELWCHFVPGRIEVLGKHTDYAGGRSLLVTTSQGVAVVSALNGARQIRMVNTDPRFQAAFFPLSPELEIPVGPWTNYAMTVTRRLLRNFGRDWKLGGVDLALASNLPPASGMSSSTAVVVGSFFALAGPNHLADCPKYKANIQSSEDLATYLACIENGRGFGQLEGDRGVGTFGGSEDHTAMLCCRPGQLSVYSFCPTRFERAVPFPDDLVFVVCHSGVLAEKTGEALGKYNAVSARAAQACAAYNTFYRTEHQTLAAVVRQNADLSLEASLDRFRSVPRAWEPPDFLFDRFRQFLVESEELIPRAAEALGKGDLRELGRLVDLSHHNSRQFLWNIIPETDWLQQSARRLGAWAASAFGAGFGGSVYAIVPAAEAPTFQRAWEAAHLERFPHHRGAAIWLSTRPAQAAQRVSLSPTS
jgi:galactokinase